MRASGVGSWPTVGSRDAVRAVRDLLVGDAPDGAGIPYLPEQPGRGPGADMIGRSAGLLVEMSADLQPSGWRVVPGAGRDMRRAESYLGQDLDELAEAYEGYAGDLKVQAAGPWTLAASLWLPRGERVVSDIGAVRDVAQSLAAGLGEHLAQVRRLVPGARVIVQLDEPALPAVLEGQVRKASGYGFVRAPDRGSVEETLRAVVAQVRALDTKVVCHSCAPQVPLAMLRRAEFDGVGLDVSLLAVDQYEALGEGVDAGLEFWAGLVPTTTDARHPGPAVARFEQVWSRIGLGRAEYDRLVVTPACGLGLASPSDALRMQRLAIEAATMLTDSSA